MSTVDERVVRMTFDNKQFEQGISGSLSSLDKLNKSLKLEGAAKGMTDVANAANGLNLSKIGDSVDGIANRFKTMSIVAITALTNIVNRAVDAGVTLVRSLTVDPVKAGLEEYETNLNSIQTILANTAHEGATLKDVNAALAELNHYSDQTIYNFGEMARNIGTFTAAGVSLKVSTEAIKGIANLAAVSGSNSQQASTAMYQLSQALAAGKVSLEDWNSVVNAGMGGKVFQDALMETARVHGVAIDDMVKKEGSFRMTLQKGWLTSSILTETLNKFTGDLTAEQLKSMGYNQQQIDGILKMGVVAQDAATKVKTMSQLIGTLQEAAGSGWSQTWQLLFGDFEEAKTLFTNVSNVLGAFINHSADARNKVLGDWKALGGRTVLIDTIATAFNALIRVIVPIKNAFRDIFPATTGAQLMAITVALKSFAQMLVISDSAQEKLRRTFAGLFAMLDLGVDVIKAVANNLVTLFAHAFNGSGKFLDASASVGDFLVKLHDMIEAGDLIPKVFGKIESALEKPIDLAKKMAKSILEFLGSINISGEDVLKFLTRMYGALSPLGHLGDTIATAWSKMVDVLGNVWHIFEPLAKKIGGYFQQIGKLISGAFDNLHFENVTTALQTGLLGGIALLIKKFVSRTGEGGMGSLGEVVDAIKESFEGLTDSLSAMQNTLRAATLLEIAAAIGVLAAAALVLSKIDPKDLTKAIGALTVLFAQLFGSMAAFEKLMGAEGMANILSVTTAMIPLAAAVDLLTIAITKLADVKWSSLVKGLIAMDVMMASLVTAAKSMPPTPGLISTAAALVVLAAGINVLVIAVTDLAGLSWQELAKGLTGVGALLGSLILFTKFAEADKGGVLQGAGIVLLAAGIKILASAMQDFGQFSWTEIGKGLATLAGSLLLIGAALYLIPPTAALSAAGVLIVAASLGMIGDAIERMGKMHGKEIAKGLLALGGALVFIAAALAVLPPTSLLSAAAIFIVAASLGMMADALAQMAEMSWGEIGKSLVLLAGALTIITVAMIFMTEALPGAAALLVVAASLMLLAPILQLFGDMSWEEIGKGLLMLAGIFTVLGVAGLLLTPLVPTLLGLGAAILLLGAGVLLAGAGVLAFSVGLTALSVAGAAATVSLVAMVSGIIGLIPYALEQIGKGVIAFANVIAEGGPAMVGAIVAVLNALNTAILEMTPKIVDTLLKMLSMLIDKLLQYVPHMVDAGNKLVLGVMKGIRDNIQAIVTVGLEIIAAYINGIAQGLPSVIDAAANLIISFVNSLANTIRDRSEEMGAAGGNLSTAIVQGMINGLKGAIGKLASAAADLAKSALDAAKHALGINSPSKEFHKVGNWSGEGMANGLDASTDDVESSAKNMGKTALSAVKDSLSSLPDAIPDNLSLNPTIAPVLDLSGVQKDASQLNSLLAMTPITVDTSYSNAKSTSSVYSGSTDTSAGDTPTVSTIFNYTQNNSSPKSLSASDIYRQTSNQLAQVKGALPKL